MKLGRQLGSGRARADDRDMQLPRSYRTGLCMSPDEPVDEPLVEPDGLLRGIERDREVLSPERAKVVAGAAHGDDERVVRDRARGRDFVALRIDARSEMDLVTCPVETDHFSNAVAKVVLGGLGQVVGGLTPDIQATGRDFVEERLPDVRARTLDKGDLGLFAPP